MNTTTLLSALQTVFGASAIASPSKFPCFDGSNNGGYITPANLASVLGADSQWFGLFPKRGEVPSNDFNNAKDWGIYFITNAADWLNGPTDVGKDQAILISYGWSVGTRSIQVLFCIGAVLSNTAGVYMRVYKEGMSPVWSDWVKA